MAKCSTVEWDTSEVRKKGTAPVIEFAKFTVGPEDASGNFTGTFQVLPSGPVEQITGNCSGNHIWFERPNNKPVYRYEADYFVKPKDSKLKTKNGTRTELAVALKNEQGSESQSQESRNTAPAPPPPPDDWIAEQGGTLLNSTDQKP